jgi:anaerobic magnesium-protoporphyrin IX monomethyl ester cyclase
MIYLYNPPSTQLRKPVLPMSVLALGALLDKKHDYTIIDGNLDDDPGLTLDRQLRWAPRVGAAAGGPILAVTVMPGRQLRDAVALCRSLKARYPHLTIIWGGYFPTQHWEACLRSDYVDYVVRGHGEVVFLELIERLRRGEDPNGLAGLAFKVDTGVQGMQPLPKSNALAPIPHPNDLPDWPYDKIEVARYVRPTFMGSRTLAHHSSYGCPFLCNFCAVVNMVNGRWFPQSAERTANVVRYLHGTWGVNAVELYDNNFFVHEARCVEFSDRIRDLNVHWWGEARIDTLMKFKHETFQAMKESGLKMVFLGAESGSDEVLQRQNKGGTATVQKTLEIAERLKSYGIAPEFSFVLGNPPDPESDVRVTLEFIKELKKKNPYCEIVLYLYTPVPLAGELYDEAKASGFAFPTTLEEWIDPDWQDFSQRRSGTMPWIQDQLRKDVGDFQRVLNAYYPTLTDHRLWGGWRWILRGASAWRYHLGYYKHPLELKVLQKLVNYQRPDTSGF